MSTTTNFKRIALVAVAALGLGVLSSVPSQAAVSGLTVTVVNGTSTAAKSDSTTAATINISGFVGANDTIVAYVVAKSIPSTAGTVTSVFYNLDSATPLLSTQKVDSTTSSPSIALSAFKVATDSVAATVSATAGNPGGIRLASSADANINHKFGFQLDSSTQTRAAGTYTYTLVVKTYEVGQSNPFTTSTRDISITVAALSTEGTTASSTSSTALLSDATTAGAWTTVTVDSTVVTSAAASTTAKAVVKLTLANSAGGTSTVKDSVTASIDKGNLSIAATGGNGTAPVGSSLATYAYSGGAVDIFIYPAGTSGTATLTIKTLNAGTFTKTVTFVATTPASIVATLNKSVIAVGSEANNSDKIAVRAQMFDANSTNFGALTTVYAYSSDTSVISNFGTACTYGTISSSSLQYSQYCELTGVKAGTANITIRDAATVAASTVSSNAVAVRVSAGVASSISVTTDKASYAPGEKGFLIVTVKDAAGLVMPSGSYSLASAVSYSANLGAATATGSGLFSSGAMTVERSSSSATAPSSTDPIAFVLFYAPSTSGSFTFSATPGAGFPAAVRTTAVTATATVADSASAALAAVSALAVTVASLKTLITTLTNLVLKIQKKVKA
jgi:hypothetical protein